MIGRVFGVIACGIALSWFAVKFIAWLLLPAKERR